MVFSDTTTKLGLIQDCEQLVFSNYGDISNNSDRLYDFTARINRSYDKLATKIMSVDGRWQFDDSNYTDLPIGSTSLVSGQQDYTLDVEYLDIEKVVALDSAGNKVILKPFDINDPIAKVYLTNINTVGGVPLYYDKFGGTLMLHPIPNYNKSLGLVVYFRRKPSYFAYTDTTKAVGVPAIFHRYLSLNASLDYAMSKELSIAGGVMRGGFKTGLLMMVSEMEDMIEDFYSKRSKDEAKFIRTTYRSSR